MMRRAASFVLLLLCGAGGCSNDITQIVVAVTTDLRVPSELDEVRTVVLGVDDTPPEEPPRVVDFESPDEDEEMPLFMTLYPRKGRDLSAPLRVEVTGFVDGTPRVRQSARTFFLEGESKLLRIHLGRDCLNTMCPNAADTCRGGTCVPNTVDPENLEDFYRRVVDEIRYPDDAGPRDTGPPPDGCEPSSEVCDGVDNDCDGTVDNDATCPPGEFCIEGSCSTDCQPPREICGDTCVDITRNPLHCGACDQVCGGTCENRDCIPMRDVAAGGRHTCSVDDAGRLFCWGANLRGQLGDGTRIPRAVPRQIEGLPPVRKIALGAAHSCALFEDGRLACWGDNEQGQVGIGRRPPATVPTPEEVMPCADGSCGQGIDVAAGGEHTCVVTDELQVKCWGRADLARLGDGSFATPRLAPSTSVPLDVPVTQVQAGSAHTCAFADIEAWCWGAGESGQLGAGDPPPAESRPLRVAWDPTVGEITAMALGYHHSCAIGPTPDGLYCWGDNTHGQIGPAGGASGAARPIFVPGLFGPIAAGPFHSCALSAETSEVLSWGLNSQGQVGPEGGDMMIDPVPVPTGPVRTVAAGVAPFGDPSTGAGNHTCALTENGSVLCWGNNDAGQLGPLAEVGAPSPEPVRVLFPAP